MGVTLLPDLGTEILIPVCAVVGIAFSLIQWLLVSKVKLTPSSEHASANNGAGKNGFADHLIEEEEGINDHSVVLKCADIQTAISEGFFRSLSLSLFFLNFQTLRLFHVFSDRSASSLSCVFMVMIRKQCFFFFLNFFNGFWFLKI